MPDPTPAYASCGIGIGAPPDVRICGAPTTGHGVTLRDETTGEEQRIPLCDEHHDELARRQAGA